MSLRGSTLLHPSRQPDPPQASTQILTAHLGRLMLVFYTPCDRAQIKLCVACEVGA
jgi:hypothetical protein